jgi:hypothetical protein
MSSVGVFGGAVMALALLGAIAQVCIWLHRGYRGYHDLGPHEIRRRRLTPWWFVLAFLLLAGSAHASTVNPSSQFILSDPALAFVALGGGIAGGMDIICDYAHTPRWERSLVEVLGSGYLCYIAQRMTGSDPAVPNSLNRALWGCVGASGVWTISWGAGQ